MPENPYFSISSTNPNAELGGGDALNPFKQRDETKGPYIVLHQIDAAAAGTQHSITPVIPASDLRDMLAAVGTDFVDVADATTAGDVRDRITQPSTETVPWADVPVETRAGLKAAFPAGGRVKFAGGVTTVPAADHPMREHEEVKADDADLALILDDAGELPSEAPGETPGTYVTVDQDEEDAVTL